MTDAIIDWAESTKIAGNNIEAAKEFIHLLAEHLTIELKIIHEAYVTNNFSTLKKQIHSLRGALCYCSVPRLKHATISFENALKTNSLHIADLYTQFKNEIKILLEKIKE